ncbi:carbohydrate kinase family protein, partial [Streptomyces sp. SID9727]|nr:carbohydrate kinase family protein [Streptomyces sp. SID9727]
CAVASLALGAVGSQAYEPEAGRVLDILRRQYGSEAAAALAPVLGGAS